MPKDVLKENLALMLSNKKGGMRCLVYNESLGGNAGHTADAPCAGANFIYDDEGRILYFDNIQNVPPHIKGHQGIYRVAVHLKQCREEIIEVFGDRKATPKAADMLRQSLEAYNEASKKQSETPEAIAKQHAIHAYCASLKANEKKRT